MEGEHNHTYEDEEGKIILDLLLIIYVFEEKKKAFLRSFHAIVIFCSSTARSYRQIARAKER